MKTSIVILTHNQLSYTKLCLESIRAHTKQQEYELIVVDNASIDGTVEWLELQPDIQVIKNTQNLGFPMGCNQGIAASSGDEILLLNNDVVVTPFWLRNLQAALHSAEDVGAVGPITNAVSYYSAVSVQYDSLENMQRFAQSVNQRSNSQKWMERLKLIGFCLLVKRKALEETGVLDERFSPGNFEDDDLCVRLRQYGYRLYLCTDTFVHHFGSLSWNENRQGYVELLEQNKKKFQEKWSVTIEHFTIHMSLLDALAQLKPEGKRVMHIGCGCGATLLELKNRNKNIEVYGIEENQKAVEIAAGIGDIQAGNAEQLLSIWPEHYFDVICITNFGSSSMEDLLTQARTSIREGGLILAQIQNANHYSIIASLLDGQNPFHTGAPLYTLREIEHIWRQNMLHIKYKARIVSPIKEGQMLHVPKHHLQDEHESFSYIIGGVAVNFSLVELLQSVLAGRLSESVQLMNYEAEQIIVTIRAFYEETATSLYTIAAHLFSHDQKKAYPLLEAVLNYEHDHREALYMLTQLEMKRGNPQAAANYLSRIPLFYERERVLADELQALLPKKQAMLQKKREVTLPLVSILIPTYNRPRYFKEALESALKQTYPHIEILIGDDSTNDETEKLIKEKYAPFHTNVVYSRNTPSLGQFENSLLLLNKAKGEYINYLMDDDLFHPRKIEKMLQYFLADEKEELRLVTSVRQLIDEDGKRLGNEHMPAICDKDTRFNGRELGSFVIMNNYNAIGEPTTVLFRKKDLQAPFGTFRGRRYGCNVDIAAWLTLLQDGDAIYLTEPLSSFRIHKGQQQRDPNKVREGLEDLAHQIEEGRRCGFLWTDEQYDQAIHTYIAYAESIRRSIGNLDEIEGYRKMKQLYDVSRSRLR